MIHCVNLNATIDAFYHLDSLDMDAVNRATQVDRYHGGKGTNVARVVATLGGPSRLVAFAGEEDHKEAAAYFRSHGVTTQLVAVPGRSRLCLILQDKKGGRETVINSPTAIHPNQGHLKLLKDRLLKTLKPGDYVTLSGSAPDGLAPSCFAALMKAASRAGARCMQDSYGEGLKLGVQARPYILKVNEHELRASFGWKAVGQAGLLKAMGRLCSMGIAIVIVTQGSKGCLVRNRDGAWKVPALPANMPHPSPVGCGDAFFAGLAWGLDRGLQFADSLCLATAAAWDNLHRPGSCFVDAESIARAADLVSLRKLTLP